MKTLKFLNDSFIFGGAFLIALTVALSAANLHFANLAVDYIVGGRVSAQTTPTRLDDEPEGLSIDNSVSRPVQQTARPYYLQPSVSDAFVQWGGR